LADGSSDDRRETSPVEWELACGLSVGSDIMEATSRHLNGLSKDAFGNAIDESCAYPYNPAFTHGRYRSNDNPRLDGEGG
jgi:hypothetical protein